jgi:hypothetical protein
VSGHRDEDPSVRHGERTDALTRRLKLLREEARACLHLAQVTLVEAERNDLRRQAARLEMQAAGKQWELHLGASN